MTPIAYQLEPNFTLSEFAVTNHADYRPGLLDSARAHWSPLKRVATMLQAVRDHYGAPVVIHSGIRTPELNAYLRHLGHPASSASQHMLGEAADFHVQGEDLREVFDWIRLESGLKFGQLILEGEPPGWIHLSLVGSRPAERCQQAMTWSQAGGYARVWE